ncbi:MAG: MFS transporter [Acidobacteriota bacterium]
MDERSATRSSPVHPGGARDGAPAGDPAGDREYRRRVNAWAMYDWANSAFFTTIVAAVFPPFYRRLALAAGASPAEATAYWAYTTSGALLLAALLGPLLGTLADVGRNKKQWLAAFAGLGVLSTAAMYFLHDDHFLWASVLFSGGALGVTGSIVFYDALLPHVARPEDIDRVSARGYAFGYLGGGLLLAFNIALILWPTSFGLADQTAAVRWSFVTVALWWAVFSLPLLRWVPEPAGPGEEQRRRARVDFAEAWRRLGGTLRHVKRYRHLALFLLAFLVYNDGIGTIIKMATAYGDEIGIGLNDLISALLITQFVGIPCSLAFGRLAGYVGSKAGILAGLAVYSGVAVLAYFMTTAFHFYLLAVLVGLVQGGTQALSRSLFGSMIPLHRSAEFFGFFSTSEKVAGILGPLLFGLIGQAMGDSRGGILLVLGFFLVGGALLLLVDVEAGRRQARQEEGAVWPIPAS